MLVYLYTYSIPICILLLFKLYSYIPSSLSCQHLSPHVIKTVWAFCVATDEGGYIIIATEKFELLWNRGLVHTKGSWLIYLLLANIFIVLNRLCDDFRCLRKPNGNNQPRSNRVIVRKWGMKCTASIVSRTRNILFEMAGSVAILQLISLFFCCGKLSRGRSDSKLSS